MSNKSWKRFLPAGAKRFVRKMRERFSRLRGLRSQDYWTAHNVTRHRKYASREESLQAFEWRSLQYLGYLELMPVTGADGLDVMDYGCGPGHDLAGFSEFSKPASLKGMDVSSSSLAESKHRLELHNSTVEFIKIEESAERLPLPDACLDLVHSSGVIHHAPDIGRILREFVRVLRPGGEARIMVYHYDSIWMHLYAAWSEMIVNNRFPGCTKREAFRALTDGPHCPISECFKAEDFIALALQSGFSSAVFTGAAISCTEMAMLPRRFDALQDERLDSESRDFLYKLTFDDRGLPLFNGRVAGVDACFVLRR